MNILDNIIADKRREVALKRSVVPVSQLEMSLLFQRSPYSLAARLKSRKAGIIAEHKRRSPSKAVINQDLSIAEVVEGYVEAGAAGISVLTDGKYFGGSLDDLLLARASVQIPLLRKDFMIDEYQVLEAKAYGADVILLIAAVLSRKEVRLLSELAKSLGLEVLLEVHNEAELKQCLMPGIDMLGVNNRDLKTFRVSLDTSKTLSSLIPDAFIKVSESGISDTESISALSAYGYQGFLIGEKFMRSESPGQAARTFINDLKP